MAKQSDLLARRVDPRNDRNSPQYDPAFAAETIRLYKVSVPDRKPVASISEGLRDLLRSRVSDPRNDRKSSQYDPAFADETLRAYKAAGK